MKVGLVRGDIDDDRKNGPWRLPRAATYANMAPTGHKSRSVLPTMISTPRPNWSVFDCLRWSLTIRGARGLSTAMSSQAKCSRGLKLPGDGSNSSPKRQKPKKAAQQMAQRTIRSGWDVLSSSCSVVTLEGWPRPRRALLMPACTRFNMGRDDCSLGSGRPRESCVFGMAERYDFTVCGVRPLSAANAQGRNSETGKGSVTW